MIKNENLKRWICFSGGHSLFTQNDNAVNIFQKIFLDCLRQRGEKLDAHPFFLIAAFFPVPDNESGHLHIIMVPSRKNKIYMGTDRSRRVCVDEHAIHGNISAAGNHVITGMNKIYSEINRGTSNKTSVA